MTMSVANTVDPDGTLIVGHYVALQPTVQLGTQRLRHPHQASDGVVGQQAVATIDPVGSIEKRQTDKRERTLVNAIFEGEIVLHRPARLGNDTTLLLDYLDEPCLVVSTKALRHPSQSPTRP